jgi:hypothetical protein
MNESIIWHLSNNMDFPLELWRHPKISIKLNNVTLSDWNRLDLKSEIANIIFLQVNEAEWKNLQSDFTSKYGNHPEVALILIAPIENSNLTNAKSVNPFLLLENPLHKHEIKTIIDKTIQSELYKRASLDIGTSCLENIGFFEGVFDLARKENMEKKETIEALEKILEYETKVKVSQEQVNKAIESVNELKEKELLEVHQVLKANEHLDILRENELKDAILTKQATEAALQFSRIEEIQMDKIIQAQNRLFAFSDKEIRALFEENKALKKKLGIPIEED